MRKVSASYIIAAFIGLALVASGCSKKTKSPVVPPEPCSVVVAAPSGGEVFITGDRVSVRWLRSGDRKLVRLDLIKGVELVGVIDPSWDGGSGSTAFYPWTATTMGDLSGEDYRIAISDLSDTACSDTTNVFGVISGCNFRFPYSVKDSIPDLTVGEQFTINWTGYETSGFANIELWKADFTNPLRQVGTIAVDQNSSGSFEWTVDTFGSGSGELFRFLVRDSNNGSCQTLSISFAIEDPTARLIDQTGTHGKRLR